MIVDLETKTGSDGEFWFEDLRGEGRKGPRPRGFSVRMKMPIITSFVLDTSRRRRNTPRTEIEDRENLPRWFGAQNEQYFS